MKNELLRRIPAVDQVLLSAEVKAATKSLPRASVVRAARDVLDRLRRKALDGQAVEDDLNMNRVAQLIAQEAGDFKLPDNKSVINCTGVVIHTNLGRAPLASEAIDAVCAVGSGYSALEYDLSTGARGRRGASVESLIVKLTGAEGALVVNNNAAAVMLALAVFARDKDVIVSRGELIEIGGSFRLPEIMAAGGCLMREVGTTNKTRLADYEDAVSERTALLFKTHTSNYKLVGFTESVSLAALVELGQDRQVPVLEDLGSGSLVKVPGIDEPLVTDSVKAGVDLITFSGDKLLGGPQAGIVVGKAGLIDALRRHPFYRAVRLDKLALAALEATLKIYAADDPLERVPVVAMLSQGHENVRRRAEDLLEKVDVPAKDAELVCSKALVGGGAVPEHELDSWAVRLSPGSGSARDLAARLRAADPPVVARVEKDAVIVDLFAVSDSEIDELAGAIEWAVKESEE